MKRALVWFRNDLRLSDNPALAAAVRHAEEVLPLFVLDTRQTGACSFGLERLGPWRQVFLREGLADLDARLRGMGSGLRVVVGHPDRVLPELAHTWEASAVYAQGLNAWEERQQEEAVARHLPLDLHPSHTLLHPDDLPFPIHKLPRVFTAFRHKVEARWQVRETLSAPEALATPDDWAPDPPQLTELLPGEAPTDPRQVLSFRGGRAAGLERLRHYFQGQDAPLRYKETRNALLGADLSSKFSPWLAQGSLSAREVYEALKGFEERLGANEGTYWLVFELLWRDFFQFTFAKHGPALFLRKGLTDALPSGDQDQGRFQAWCDGRTGEPFIDANMRELAATGWMSNRGRQNAASFLVHDLGLDWRMGACWFERLLIDHDPCSNWGNWAYIAGVGNDPRGGRRFDPQDQAARYDPDGTYFRHWSSGEDR